jgi:uncharacterized protein YcaQ
MVSVQQLRVHAISASFFEPTTLKTAVNKLGFVQADPIRAPARAQDLILRQRVDGYRAGDLDRRYPSLDIEEDILYAYGFMPRRVWRLLHPRRMAGLSTLEKKVLDLVFRFGPTHPTSLEAHLGRKRVVNAWGGYSKATTRALEDLHYRGLLRIARRENGIRVYEAAPAVVEPLPLRDRLQKLIMVVVKILSPIPEQTLHANIARYRRLGDTRAMVKEMVGVGMLQKAAIEGLSYVWPSDEKIADETPDRVRFLAPFDPLVWDRRRFEHLWRWPYRFEAYTPTEKRVRGYYALPLLWRDSVIGWANAKVVGNGLDVETGFIEKRPREKEFRTELEAEITRLKAFLDLT